MEVLHHFSLENMKRSYILSTSNFIMAKEKKINGITIYFLPEFFFPPFLLFSFCCFSSVLGAENITDMIACEQVKRRSTILRKKHVKRGGGGGGGGQ
ncbi:hypothetical protein ACJX0J_010563, partial [Zea mays]